MAGTNGDVTVVGTASAQSTVYAFLPSGEGPIGRAGPFTSTTINDQSEISPDGLKATTRSSNADIRVLELATGQLSNPIANGGSAVSCAGDWSPDGTKVAYVTATGTVTRLQVVNATGGVPTTVLELTTAEPNDGGNWALCPTFTPDGDELVFPRHTAQCSGGTGCATITVTEWIQAVGVDGQGLRDVTPQNPVSWSTDGAEPDQVKLAYVDVAGDGSEVSFTASHTLVNRGEIQTAPLSGGAATTVAGGAVAITGFFPLGTAYSPDGTRIVYSAVQGSNVILRTVDSDGTDDRVFADASDGPAAADTEPQWLPALLPVVIASAPPAVTNSTSAAFEFAAPSPPAGHYECRLDAGTFVECSSPKTYTGLSEGDHSFRVRYVPDQGPAGQPALAVWRIDTTPPTTTVDSAPSGVSNPPDATITFHASETNSTFTCQLDTGAQTPCTSPVQLTGLSAGAHELRIRATDPAGNTQTTPAVVSWSVAGDKVEPVAECPGTTLSKVTFGPIVAIAPSAGACFDTEVINGRQVRVSRGTVVVNGMKLTPKPGTRIAVDGHMGGGTVRAIGGEAKVEFGKLSWTDDVVFDSLASTTGGRVAARVSGIAASFFDQKIVGLPTFEFSADNGGQTALGFTIELPEAFTALPASLGTEAEDSKLSASFSATASNDLGVFFAGKASISDLWLKGKVKLKNLTLGVDQGKGTFEGSVGLALAKGAVKPPGIGEDAVLTATVSIGPDGILGGLRSLVLEASNIGVHLGYGLFLQRVGGSLERITDGIKWAWTGGASWGPKLHIEVSGVELFDGEAVSLDGAYTLTVPDGAGPIVLGATGAGKVIDIPFANGSVTYSNPGGITMTGNYDYSFLGYGFQANITRAWFDPSTNDFSIEALGESDLPGPADLLLNDRAEVVVSSVGVSACLGENGGSVGFKRRWGQDWDLFTDSCDLDSFRRGAAAAQVTDRTVRVTDGPVTAIRVTGTDAPPKVTLTGPGGKSAKQTRVLEDPARKTTTVLLFDPPPGTWTIAGPGIARVDVSDALPPLKVDVKVRGRGAKRTLTWKAQGLKGHRLLLVERGRGGSAKRLVETARAKGRKTFRPSAFVAGTSRRIEAVVTRDGIARRTFVAARFKASAPKIGKARKIKRKGKRLSWKRAANAKGYAVAIALPDGRGLAFETRKPRLELPVSARKGPVGVTVVALGEAGRFGRAVVKRLGSRPR